MTKESDPSFQILHAFHILERTLGEFIKRSAVFDIVFWDGEFVPRSHLGTVLKPSRKPTHCIEDRRGWLRGSIQVPRS